jgi:hypothetical protein
MGVVVMQAFAEIVTGVASNITSSSVFGIMDTQTYTGSFSFAPEENKQTNKQTKQNYP